MKNPTTAHVQALNAAQAREMRKASKVRMWTFGK